MTDEKLKQLVAKYRQYVIDFRRELHMHPEIANEEFRTTARVSEELTKAGISHKVLNPTGVIAEITGKKSGKTIALRGDMDALPMDELNTCEYQSQNPGIMHACGHDGHTAMLLGAAKVLNEVKENIHGRIRFLFQPAEEITQGAQQMISQGCMEGVDNVFGIHVDPLAPAGTIAIGPGPSHASADILKITFTGKGGHGAHPDCTVDALVMAADFVMGLQTIVARKLDPLQPAVVTIGRLEAGTRFNIIAETAVLEGTVRCFDVKIRNEIESLVRRYADLTAKMYGGTAAVEYTYGTLPLINEKTSALFAQRLIKTHFGEDALLPVRISTGGEDFSFFLEKAPGAFGILGVGNPDKNPGAMIHHGCFDMDEEALAIGTELYCRYALEYLKQQDF